jgi:hypothetical protein
MEFGHCIIMNLAIHFDNFSVLDQSEIPQKAVIMKFKF